MSSSVPGEGGDKRREGCGRGMEKRGVEGRGGKRRIRRIEEEREDKLGDGWG